jgi:CubicO group peptidase (beta-lactamase class C family)
MKKFLVYSFFLLLFVNLFGCKSKKYYYPAEIKERISQVENSLCGWVITQDSTKWTLQDRMSKYRTRGVSIAVVNDYKIEWAKGYGWADSLEGRRVTPKTRFQAASISKSLNALGILRLVQENKLDLHTDINQYLQSWKFPYDSLSKGKKITLAHLLSHTAGLSVHGFPGYATTDTLPALTAVLDGKRPANTEAIRSQFAPGDRFQYSGGGTTISQQIILDVTGKTYEDYMWNNVLHPMGMTGSSFAQPPVTIRPEWLATAYYTDGREVKGKYHVYPEQAAAGLWTTPSDLCRYIIETQLALQGKSEKVLSQDITKLRLTPFIDGNAALGVFIETRGNSKYFQHAGGNEGFTCQYFGSMEEGKGVVVMTNSENGSIIEEIVNSVASVYQWKDFYQPVIKKVIPVAEKILDSYLGTYDLNGDTITITKRDGDLFVNFRGMLWKIFFTSDTDFFVQEYKADLKFQIDSEGRVTGFTLFGAVLAKKTE